MKPRALILGAGFERLSAQRGVPILVLGGGEVIPGSGEIVCWAEGHPNSAAA